MSQKQNKLKNIIIGAVFTLAVAFFSRLFFEEKPPRDYEAKPKKEHRDKNYNPKENSRKDSLNENKTSDNISEIKGKVKFIPDGDTIHLTDGTKVRLLGINCPEIFHDQNLSQKCGNEAYDFLKTLIQNKEVIVKFNESRKFDQYQRVLGDVYVGEVWVNYEMIVNGYAFVYSTSENELPGNLFQAEVEAQTKKVGIWQGENPSELFEKFNPRFESGELSEFADKNVLVKGVIDSFQKNKSAVVLMIKLESGVIVKASLSKKNYLHFSDLKSEKFKNKKISLIGKVSTFKGAPEITIRYPTQFIIN